MDDAAPEQITRAVSNATVEEVDSDSLTTQSHSERRCTLREGYSVRCVVVQETLDDPPTISEVVCSSRWCPTHSNDDPGSLSVDVEDDLANQSAYSDCEVVAVVDATLCITGDTDRELGVTDAEVVTYVQQIGLPSP